MTGVRASDPQVATETQVGVLGNLNVFDTPFATNAFTAQLILDQQARSLGDVLANDPSVRQNTSRYSESEAFYIRGFQVDTQNVSFNGLSGLVDYRQPSIEGIERVELFKGPSGLITNSSSDNAVGGSVNFVPKRATDRPVTRASFGYASDSEGEAGLDIGRRFGTGGSWGIRANVAARYGDTPIDNQRETYGVGTLGLDYRSNRLRLGFDLSHQDRTLLANLSEFSILPGFAVPVAPKSTINVVDRSSYYRKHTTFGVATAEFDLSSSVTVFAAYGHATSLERYRGPYAPLITDAAGDVSIFVIPYVLNHDADSARAGIRANLTTGPIKHRLTLAADGYWDKFLGGFAFNDTLSTNLYRPVPLAPITPSYPDPPTSYDQRNHRLGVSLTDVVTAWDGRVTLIAGVREAKIQSTSRDPSTNTVTSNYSRSKLTPAVALLIKPAPRFSLYGNYVQQLLTGPTAPIGAANANAVFPPIVAKQYETGAKYDFGRGGVTLALFQIDLPVGILRQPSGGGLPVFSLNGEQRNRGIELDAFGEITKGFRILGGATFLDGKQAKTADLNGDGRGDNDGRRAPGVAKAQVNLGAEWDVGKSGLTLTGKIIYTSSEHTDVDSDRSIPSWTRFDLGARYAFRAGKTPLTARINIENVADKSYWASASAYGLSTSAPRTVLVSLAANF